MGMERNCSLPKMVADRLDGYLARASAQFIDAFCHWPLRDAKEMDRDRAIGSIIAFVERQGLQQQQQHNWNVSKCRHVSRVRIAC